MSWGQQCPGNHQLPYSMEKLCRPLLLYLMTVWMHIKLPYFPILWTRRYPSGIIPCIFSSSPFPPHICPPSWLHLWFLMVSFLHLSSVLLFDFGGLAHSSVTRFYPLCLCPLWYFVYLFLRLVMKLVVPLRFWLITWSNDKRFNKSETSLPYAIELTLSLFSR